MAQGYSPEFLRSLEAEGLITIAPGALDQPLRGAVCDCCDQHMLEADGCVPYDYLIDGQRVPALRYENDVYPGEELTHRCHDCGCKLGQYHHHGDDMAICPKCGGQAAFCGCIEGLVLNPNTPQEVMVLFEDEED